MGPHFFFFSVFLLLSRARRFEVESVTIEQAKRVAAQARTNSTDAASVDVTADFCLETSSLGTQSFIDHLEQGMGRQGQVGSSKKSDSPPFVRLLSQDLPSDYPRRFGISASLLRSKLISQSCPKTLNWISAYREHCEAWVSNNYLLTRAKQQRAC